MNDFSPFDCPDCDLTVKHHHPKPMTLVDAEAQFDIQTFVVTSSGDPSPEVTELLAQEGWSIVRTEWLRDCGDVPQSEVAGEHAGLVERPALVEELAKHQGLVGARDPQQPDVWFRWCICGWDGGPLAAGEASNDGRSYRGHLAEALLPLVERCAAEKAAGELDAVAEELLDFGDTAPSKQQVHLAAWLQATADNLRTASPATDKETTDGR